VQCASILVPHDHLHINQMSASIRLWRGVFRVAGRRPWSAELPSRLVRVHLHSATRTRHPRAWPGWTMSCVPSVLMDDGTVTVACSALSVTEKI
jgi:hypothetical protein